MGTTKRKFVVFLVVLLTLGLTSLGSAADPLETLDKGDISYFRYNDPAFAGVDLLIRDEATWQWFWKLHTAGLDTPPPVPAVNFGRDMVIVTVLGYQTSGGGPGIEVLDVTVNNPWQINVLVEDDETPGPLTLITNPFHIVKVRRANCFSVIFEHEKPED